MRTLKELNENKLLFFDIETATIVRELVPDTPLYNSWEYKVNKDGKMTQEDVLESFKKEAGLYPEFSKIVTIVVGVIYKGKIHLKTLDFENEKDILNEFNNVIYDKESFKLIGFVNIGFDTPFVFKRMLINGIIPHDKLDSSGLKPWTVEEVDLGKEWQGTSFSRASLINIATAFGLPSPKEDISGADVGRVYWEEGESGLKRIAAYCREDVKTTINIFRKMRLQEPLELAEPTVEMKDDEPQPVLKSLLDGAPYNKETKSYLIAELALMSEDERDKTFVLLDSIVSTAKGKKTKITKTHVKALRKEFENE